MAPVCAQVFDHVDHALRQLVGLGKHNRHLGTQSPQPLTYRNAALEQKGADLVDHTGALANQPFTVRPYSKGQKNDLRDAEAISEAVQRPTMKFVAIKTVEQLDLQGLHRYAETKFAKLVRDSASEGMQLHILKHFPMKSIL